MSAVDSSASRGGAVPRLLVVVAMLAAAALIMRSGIGGASRAPSAAGDRIQWRPIAGAAAAAHQAGRPLLYDFSAAWCGPCRLMQREMFSDARIADQINRAFVPVHVVDRSREDGRNPPEVDALQARFRIEAFPTVIVVSPDGGDPVVFEGYGGRDEMLKGILDAGRTVSLAMRRARSAPGAAPARPQ
jgi:thiol:disulfide interchange protein